MLIGSAETYDCDQVVARLAVYREAEMAHGVLEFHSASIVRDELVMGVLFAIGENSYVWG
jgi:hypothetical protein